MRIKGINGEISGILLDMDGLLVNSEKLYWQANIQAAKEAKLGTPDDTYLKLSGASKQMMQEFYHHYFENRQQINAFIARTNELVWQWTDEGKLKLRSGVQEMLDWMQKAGMLLAVVSSNEEKVVDHEMWATGIRNYFDFCLSAADIQTNNLRSKPAPDLYLLAAQKSGLVKENLLAFEDSSSGVQAATSAGIKCVMIPYLVPPTAVDKKNAVLICKSFSEFLNRI